MTSPSSPRIVSPSGLIAACGPLIGHEPSRCVVGFIGGVPNRTSPVVVRFDLVDHSETERAAAVASNAIAGSGGRYVDVVCWIGDPGDTHIVDLSGNAMISALGAALEDLGLELRSCFSTNGNVFWVHDFDRPFPSSTEIDQSDALEVRAELALEGFSPLANREALALRTERDPMRNAEVRASMEATAHQLFFDQAFDEELTFLSRLLLPRTPSELSSLVESSDKYRVQALGLDKQLTSASVARILRGLADIRIRDCLILRIVKVTEADRAEWQATIEMLCDLIRATPSGLGAPPASLLAIVAWLHGEGSLVTLALDRAENDNPQYSLARLAREVIGRGLDPRIWAHSMSSLTESEIRQSGRRAVA